jgi:hypothetical protein
MMYFGRWRHAVRQRLRAKRRAVLGNDRRELEATRLANGRTDGKPIAAEVDLERRAREANYLRAKAAHRGRQERQ